jgi:hypothetical protein
MLQYFIDRWTQVERKKIIHAMHQQHAPVFLAEDIQCLTGKSGPVHTRLALRFHDRDKGIPQFDDIHVMYRKMVGKYTLTSR